MRTNSKTTTGSNTEKDPDESVAPHPGRLSRKLRQPSQIFSDLSAEQRLESVRSVVLMASAENPNLWRHPPRERPAPFRIFATRSLMSKLADRGELADDIGFSA
jgi:hypothetical protein